jgi:hypothetical protein
MGMLVLDTITLPCEHITCVPRQPQLAQTTQTDRETDWDRFRRKVEPLLTESVSENWQVLYEHAGDLVVLRDCSLATIGYGKLRDFCGRLGISCLEGPILELGKTHLFPRWSGTTVPSMDVTIVIKESLTEQEKAIALAHELGHYIHHYGVLEWWVLLFIQFHSCPWLETVVAEHFPSSQLHHQQTIREERADLFASLMMLPAWSERAAEAYVKMTITLPPRTPMLTSSLLVHWLERYFKPGHHHLPWNHAEQHVYDSLISSIEYERRPYSFDKSLRERLYWCIFNRESAIQHLIEAEQEIEDSMVALSRRIIALRRDPPDENVPQLLKHLSLKDAEAFVKGNPQHSDPVIVGQTDMTFGGYLALTPAWASEQDVTPMATPSSNQ